MKNLFKLMSQLLPNVVAMLGVGSYAATKVVDAIFLGLSTVQIIGIIATGGGSIVLGLALLKTLTKKLGKKAAISF